MEHKETDETQNSADSAEDLKLSELQNNPVVEKEALKIKVVKDEKQYREMTIDELKALRGF